VQHLRKLHFVGGIERPCTITTHTVLTAHFTFRKDPIGKSESKKIALKNEAAYSTQMGIWRASSRNKTAARQTAMQHLA
jgi:hypothetical protein